MSECKISFQCIENKSKLTALQAELEAVRGENKIKIEKLESAIANAITDITDLETSLFIDYGLVILGPSRIAAYMKKALSRGGVI